MIFQLFFECLNIPEVISQQTINLPCVVAPRRDGVAGIYILLNYEELNAYVESVLGLNSADLTHIVLGDEKNVL